MKVGNVLTLRDVMSVSTVETEAETLIMQSLDEYDPTKVEARKSPRMCF